MTSDDSGEAEAGVETGVARVGGVSYLHIPARDVREAALFYEAVFAWNVRNVDSARPSFTDATGHVAGAWMSDQVISTEPGLLPYIYVADVDDAAALITAHGGKIVKPGYPEGNLRVATFRDPAGNLIGLWQEVTT
jgi:predicted enzyme related to lactoylglutathione lyase